MMVVWVAVNVIVSAQKKVFDIESRGYKVVTGVTGYRYPAIAKTWGGFKDLNSVIKLLEESVLKFKNHRQEKREVSFHEVINF